MVIDCYTNLCIRIGGVEHFFFSKSLCVEPKKETQHERQERISVPNDMEETKASMMIMVCHWCQIFECGCDAVPGGHEGIQ